MPVKAEDILKDFERAIEYFSPIHADMEKDFEFEAGKQWDSADVETLRQAGVKALTINKLRPIIKLISGIERQSKSDWVAFPEGQEDGLKADIITALLKNVSKQSKAERKLSMQFKRGVIGGMDFIEPFIDYTYDLINGEIKLRNVNPMRIYFDPDAEEYDLCDAKFQIKFSPNLTKDQLKTLYPDKSKKIDDITDGKIDIKNIKDAIKHVQGKDYPSLKDGKVFDELREQGYDLVEYYYKEASDKSYIVDPVLQVIQEVESKEAGKTYLERHPDAKMITKAVPVVRLACMVGSEIIHDDVCWTYPKWKNYPIIPFFADWLTIPIQDRALQIQGIVRNIKDLQEEYNKRRTQELRHLNSSVNSGIMAADDALSPDQEEKLKKYGSSPGIFVKYKAGTQGKPERIPPMPLSQAHSQLAEENAQDLKEASGVNPDLLANADSSQSGRAILLKQKQGLVMVQEYLDNYAETKKLLGRFLLSQLGEVYTVETAVKVLGDDFIKKYQEFNKPVIDPTTQQPILDQNGQIKTEVDSAVVGQIFNDILNDVANIDKYDVSIGEGAYSETVKMSNYLTLADMAKSGIPIPPDVLIQESMLPQGSKQKILAAIEKAQLAQAQAQAVKAMPQGQGEKEDVTGQGSGR